MMFADEVSQTQVRRHWTRGERSSQSRKTQVHSRIKQRVCMDRSLAEDRSRLRFGSYGDKIT